jgi:hypothetical protein
MVKLETGRKSVHEDIHTLNVDGNIINNQKILSLIPLSFFVSS